jgi:hypothetical protein
MRRKTVFLSNKMLKITSKSQCFDVLESLRGSLFLPEEIEIIDSFVGVVLDKTSEDVPLDIPALKLLAEEHSEIEDSVLACIKFLTCYYDLDGAITAKMIEEMRSSSGNFASFLETESSEDESKFGASREIESSEDESKFGELSSESTL